MHLTDATELHLCKNLKYLAVAEGTAPATLVSIVNQDVFRCGWQFEDGHTEDGDIVIRECNAYAVGFDNGFVCLNGHSHRFDAQYFDADEIEAAHQSGRVLPLNARSV